MFITAVKEKMLYCPKCQQSYKQGEQRFCFADGARLLPAPNFAKATNNSVFSRFVGQNEADKKTENKLASIPRFTVSDLPPLPVSTEKNGKDELSFAEKREKEKPDIEKKAETEFVKTEASPSPEVPRKVSEKETETIKKIELPKRENLPAAISTDSGTPKSRNLAAFVILGLLAFSFVGWMIWSYFLSPNGETSAKTQTQDIADPRLNAAAIVTHQPQIPEPEEADKPEDSQSAPQIESFPPPNFVYFQNAKQNLKGDLADNFIGFSLYYPNDWQVNKIAEDQAAKMRGKFLDISKKAEDGRLSEHMLISYYKSGGTFEQDAKKFPQLARETSETVKIIIPNYQVFSEGETVINGKWRAFEIKFQGGGETKNGVRLIIWGRRLFIPAERAGSENGFEITMLATSLAPDVKSVDDVGTRGDLAAVLKSFEPNPAF
jgi:hypothetical protein